MNVYSIMATAGRHRCAERALTCFLEQDYAGEHTLLIYNNSPVTQTLDPSILPALPSNKHVLLVNQSTSSVDALRYRTLGAIYNDAIQVVPPEADLLIFWDDDDLYLPNHITEGVKCYQEALAQGFKAYKPRFSFFRHADGMALVANNMEPSVFVSAAHIKEFGFSDTTSDQHMQWYQGLGDKLFVKENGVPTLIYNWGDRDIPTFKTSGNPGNPENFQNYRNFSQEHGDGVLSRISKEAIDAYYKEVNV